MSAWLRARRPRKDLGWTRAEMRAFRRWARDAGPSLASILVSVAKGN